MSEETQDQKLLRESLERWRENRPTYRKIALAIMAGKRDMDPTWPNYVCRDVQTEMGKIRREREEEEQSAERKRREREAQVDAERADKDWLL